MNLESRNDFLTFTGLFLLALVTISIGLSMWANVPLVSQIHWSVIDFLIGMGAAAAMLVVFTRLNSLREQATDALGKSLAKCEWYDLLVMAILVGISEELLFRGFLEQFMSHWSFWGSFIVTNVIFGLLHAVSLQYAVVATVLGMILSLLTWGVGEFNLLRPMVAHAAYDFVGFLMIARETRAAQKAQQQAGENLVEADHEDVSDR